MCVCVCVCSVTTKAVGFMLPFLSHKIMPLPVPPECCCLVMALYCIAGIGGTTAIAVKLASQGSTQQSNARIAQLEARITELESSGHSGPARESMDAGNKSA